MQGKLGDYIERVKEVIPYNKEIPVKGLSVEKKFIETNIANLERILVPFQLVKRGQFAYAPVTSRNGEKLSLAFNSAQEQIQTSITYMVFQIIKPNLLNCFYLELFFKQSWIDKIARYASTGTVRETLSFESFSRFPIVVPSSGTQERIVSKYQTVTKYIEVKKRINELLEKQMRAYFHILFDDLKEHEIKVLGELFTIIRGGRPPRSNRWLEELYFCKEEGIPWLKVGDISREYKFVNSTEEQLTPEGFKRGRCTLIGGGNIIFMSHAHEQQIKNITINSTKLCFTGEIMGLKPKENVGLPFLFYLLKQNVEVLLRKCTASTKTETIRKNSLLEHPIKFPSQTLIDKFNNFCEPIFELQKSNEQIIQKLMRLQKCWVESLD